NPLLLLLLSAPSPRCPDRLQKETKIFPPSSTLEISPGPNILRPFRAITLHQDPAVYSYFCEAVRKSGGYDLWSRACCVLPHRHLLASSFPSRLRRFISYSSPSFPSRCPIFLPPYPSLSPP